MLLFYEIKKFKNYFVIIPNHPLHLAFKSQEH